MPKDGQYTEKEAQRRFMNALKAAVNTPPKPPKDVLRKRPKVQQKRTVKK